MYIIYIWLFQHLYCIHIKTFTCSLQTTDCATWHRKNSLSYVKVDGKATPHWRQLAHHMGPPSFRVFGSLDGFSSNKMIWKERGQTGHHLFLGFLVHPYFFCCFLQMPLRSFWALPDLMHLVGVSTFIYFFGSQIISAMFFSLWEPEHSIEVSRTRDLWAVVAPYVQRQRLGRYGMCRKKIQQLQWNRLGTGWNMFCISDVTVNFELVKHELFGTWYLPDPIHVTIVKASSKWNGMPVCRTKQNNQKNLLAFHRIMYDHTYKVPHKSRTSAFFPPKCQEDEKPNMAKSPRYANDPVDADEAWCSILSLEPGTIESVMS